MKAQEAKEIIQAGLAWADWTAEQKEAMAIAVKAIHDIHIDLHGNALTKNERAIRQFKLELKDAESYAIITQNQAFGFLNGMRYMNELYNLKIDFPEKEEGV